MNIKKMGVISADNIQEITAEAFNKASAPVPSFEEHLENVKSSLDLMEMKDKTRENIKEKLDNIAENPPEGLKFAAVWYTKISAEENQATLSEFVPKVAPAFLHDLATKWEKDLLDKGFDSHAVNEMEAGNSPVNKDGLYYAWDVHHIIERDGCGEKMATEIKENPDWPKGKIWGSPLSREINHFNNLYFIPIPVHDVINTFKKAQLHGIKDGETRLLYMLVPDRKEGDPPFYPYMEAQVEQKPDPVLMSFDARAFAVRCAYWAEKVGESPDSGDELCERITADLRQIMELHKRTQEAAQNLEGNKRARQRTKSAIAGNKAAVGEHLKTIFGAVPELAEHEIFSTEDFSSLLPDNMSEQPENEGEGVHPS